nr:peptidylprolyl isomerase [candidate division Zixibacteria bacterium]
MKKCLLLIIAILVTAAVIAGCKTESLTRDDILANNFPVVVIDDGQSKVMATDLYLRLANSDLLEKGGVVDSSVFFDTLREIVLDSIISLEAFKVDLKKDLPLYRTYRVRFEDFYVKYLYEKLVIDSIQVDSAEVDSFFRSRPETFSYREQVRARALVISADGLKRGADSLEYKGYTDPQLDSMARDSIYVLRAQVDSGADLGQLAYDYSMNRETGKKGGELGYFFRNTYRKEFEDHAFSQAPGTVSEPFKTPDGWNILEVIDHVDSGQAPLTPEFYEQARQMLRLELARTRSVGFMDSIIAAADIVYNDSALSNPNLYAVPDSEWAAIINHIDTILFYKLPDYLHQYKAGNGYDTLTLDRIHDGIAFKARTNLLILAGNDLGMLERPDAKKQHDDLYHKYAKDMVEKASHDYDWTPSDSLIEDYYQRNINKYVFDKPVYVQHIIVQDSLYGEFLRDQALSGVDFLDLAKENYPGAEEIRVAAADLGWIGEGEMPEAFYRAALMTSPKHITHPVKTEWGYHIIKVVDRRYNMTLEQVRASIVDALKKIHQAELRADWERSLMDKHRIKYNLEPIKRITMASKDRR